MTTPPESLSKLTAQFLLVYVPEDKRDAASETLGSLVSLAFLSGMTENATPKKTA